MKGESYEDFVDKFKPKLTTDDCYTPPEIYEAVLAWTVSEYGIDREKVVRPFWPGADYQQREYKPEEVVVDNTPFSIITPICKLFRERSVRFFLFAPALTLLSPSEGCCGIAAGVTITYHNGATVNTSFVTNLDKARLRTAPTLYKLVTEANKQLTHEGKKQVPRFEYPDDIVTAAIANQWSKYGIDWRVMPEECAKIGTMDSQRLSGKSIFGNGLLLSTRAAAERAAATKWQLSEREKELQRNLGA